jgi:hypothetical protein
MPNPPYLHRLTILLKDGISMKPHPQSIYKSKQSKKNIIEHSKIEIPDGNAYAIPARKVILIFIEGSFII